MRKISMLVILGFVGAGGCGGDNGLAAKDACKQSAVAFCERILRCEGSNGLSAIGYVSVDDCAIHMQTSTCSGTSDVCGAGQTYRPDVAQSCVNAMKDLACTSQTTPAVCDEVCTGSTSPFGGGPLSLQDACKKMAAVYCTKAFTCGPDSAISFLASDYDSQAECASALETICAEDGGCGSGRTFRGDKANQCLTEFTALSCTQLDDQPAVCEEVCGSSGSSGTSGSGGTGGTVPAGSGPPYQAFCNEMMTAYCDHCGVAIGITTEACLSAVLGECATMKETDLCTTGSFQSGQGQACLDAIQTMFCTDSSSTPACESEALCR